MAEQKAGRKITEDVKKAYEELPDYLKALTGGKPEIDFGDKYTGYYAWNEEQQSFEQIVPPLESKDTGTTTPGTIKSFKFSTSQKTALIGAGITSEEMGAVEANLANGYSLDEIIEASGFSPEEESVLKRTFTGEKEEKETPKFLTEDYIRREFIDGLKEEYPLEKYDTLGWQSKAKKEKLQQDDINKEIQKILKQIEELRATGLTDKEIDKML